MIHEQPATNATRILAGLLETRTGQQIAPSRYWRIQTALAPMLKSAGIPDLDSLVAVLNEADNEALVQQALEAMLNNESFFFRDTSLFAVLKGQALPMLHDKCGARRRLRIWSAGCSTGQEAYSIAMLLKDDADLWKDWTVEIVASDISRSILDRAREGRFSQFEIQRGLSVDHMLRYFDQQDQDWVIDESVRSMVQFREDNLLRPRLDLGVFDLILCRNVLMYFAPETRHVAYSRLARSIAPHGLLMLGAAETVMGHTDMFEADTGLRGMYRRRAGESGRPLSAGLTAS